MARIALISRSWNASTEALALGLHQAKNEITVITSHGEKIEGSYDFPILTYFRSWTAAEALRLFPRLLSSAPDIWHFVFGDTKVDRPKGAHTVLALLAKALHERKVAASFYGSVVDRAYFAWKPFLSLCDLVTLGTRESLMYLKRQGYLPKRISGDVLPPVFLSSQAHGEIRSEILGLCERLEPFVLVPTDEFNQDNNFSYFPESYQFLFLGPRPYNHRVSSRFLRRCYFLSQSLSPAELQYISQRCSLMLMAFENMSLLELVRWHEFAVTNGKPVIVNPEQVEALPGLCLQKRTGLILEGGHDQLALFTQQPHWLQLMSSGLSQRTTEKTPSLQLYDQTLNRLHRLYSELR